MTKAAFLVLCVLIPCLLSACAPPRGHIPEDLSRMAGIGKAEAQYRVGRLYAGYYGSVPDNQKAIYWYEKAARQDYPKAVTALAALLRKTAQGPDAYKAAAAWNAKAAALHDADAAYFMGFAAEEGFTAASEQKTAADWYRQAAAAHHPRALYALGRMEEARGAYPGAVQWYMEAASYGDEDAKLAMVDAYLYGRALPVNHARAIQYLHELAGRGNAAAQFNLARFYEEGRYVAADRIRAGDLYAQAAANGIRAASFRLSENGRACMDEARGMDGARAQACLLARNAGSGAVAYRIGRLYEEGAHLPQRADLARAWYGQAARRGYAAAILPFARLSAAQKATWAGDATAYAWLSAYAHAGGDEDGVAEIAGALEQRMSWPQKKYAAYEMKGYEDILFKRCRAGLWERAYFQYARVPVWKADVAMSDFVNRLRRPAPLIPVEG